MDESVADGGKQLKKHFKTLVMVTISLERKRKVSNISRIFLRGSVASDTLN